MVLKNPRNSREKKIRKKKKISGKRDILHSGNDFIRGVRTFILSGKRYTLFSGRMDTLFSGKRDILPSGNDFIRGVRTFLLSEKRYIIFSGRRDTLFSGKRDILSSGNDFILWVMGHGKRDTLSSGIRTTYPLGIGNLGIGF